VSQQNFIDCPVKHFCVILLRQQFVHDFCSLFRCNLALVEAVLGIEQQRSKFVDVNEHVVVDLHGQELFGRQVIRIYGNLPVFDIKVVSEVLLPDGVVQSLEVLKIVLNDIFFVFLVQHAQEFVCQTSQGFILAYSPYSEESEQSSRISQLLCFLSSSGLHRRELTLSFAPASAATSLCSPLHSREFRMAVA